MKTDIFKKLISGEALPARYNYGRETLYVSWRNTAFVWRLNSDVPRVMMQRKDDETQWRPYMKRINVIELSSSFTSDPNLVDPDKNVFLEDTSLRGFFQSFDGRCCSVRAELKQAGGVVQI